MQKSTKSILFILCFIICISFTSCKNIQANNTQNNKEEYTGMKVIADKNTYHVGTEVISFKLENESNIKVETGEWYEIKEYKNGVWNTVPLDFGINFILLCINPKESMSFDIRLYPSQYNYNEGKYKVIKEIEVGGKMYEVEFEFELISIK